MNRFQILGISLGLVFIMSCVKVKKKDEPEQSSTPHQTQESSAQQDLPQPVTEVKVLTADDIHLDYRPTQTPNNYTARLSWPAVKDSRLHILLSNGQTLETQENSIEIPALSFQTNLTAQIDQIGLSSQKVLSHVTLQLTAPEDIVFEGNHGLSSSVEKTVERVFFKKDLRLLTYQYNLKLRAKQLIAEDGVSVANFPEGAEAALQTRGLSGGTVDFKFDEAQGSLEFHMSGQKGGRGLSGYVCESAVCAPNGGADSGDSGELILDIQNQEHFRWSFRRYAPSGGDTGDIVDLMRGRYEKNCQANYSETPNIKDQNNRLSCQTPPTQGQPGQAKKVCIKNYDTRRFECE